MKDQFEEIVDRLVLEWNYPPGGAKMIINKLRAAHPTVQSSFWSWWEKGVVPEVEAAGIALQDLIDHHGMNPIAALLTIDWLIRDPDAALHSLQKGHDRVS